MTFQVGETVVYPHHGTAVVVEVSTRKVKGVEKTYVTLRPESNESMTIKVPADKLATVGVRDVIDADGIEQVFEVLTKDQDEEPINWSRRYKTNVEKLKSNDILKVAEVIRDLSRRGSGKGLSAGEKTMLGKARQIMCAEIASSKNVNEDEAAQLLDDVLGVCSEDFQ